MLPITRGDISLRRGYFAQTRTVYHSVLVNLERASGVLARWPFLCNVTDVHCLVVRAIPEINIQGEGAALELFSHAWLGLCAINLCAWWVMLKMLFYAWWVHLLGIK
jgi:hypothetical protein